MSCRERLGSDAKTPYTGDPQAKRGAKVTAPRNVQSVSEHYSRSDLAAAILAALRTAGKNVDALTLDDLAPVDQLHTRGKQATLELARRAGLSQGMQVLDVGGGIGGPARTRASELGCVVTVLALTVESGSTAPAL